MKLIFSTISEAFDVSSPKVTCWYNIGESVATLPLAEQAVPGNPVVRGLAILTLKITSELARLGQPTHEQVRQQEVFFGELNAGKLNAGQLLEWISVYEAECDVGIE